MSLHTYYISTLTFSDIYDQKYRLNKNLMPNSSCELLPCDLKGFFPTETETSISRNTRHACPEGGMEVPQERPRA